MLLSIILSWAVVTLSSSFMRQAPDYESALENQMLMGALVQTTGETERYWVKVQAEDYIGWVTNLGIHELTDEEKDAYLKAPKWICTAEYSRVMEKPCPKSAAMCDFTMGNLVRQTGKAEGDWTQVLLPDGRTGWVPTADVRDFREWAESRKACPCCITSLAKRFVGTPYMWGGNSIKHFDCSGLVKFCYFMHGIILPRNAREQIQCGTPVADGEWKKGDLLFFGTAKPLKVTHVAIYLGDGRIVHSSLLVRNQSLEDYGRKPIGAVRIIGNVDKDLGITSILKDPYYFPQDGEQK